MDARCQICGTKDFHWTIRQAEIHVGTIQYYKIQACRDCTRRIEEALLTVLALRKGAAPTGTEP